MLTWAAVVFLVLGIACLLAITGLPNRSKQVFLITQSSLSIMGNRNLDDLEKEKALQNNALAILSLFFALGLRGSVSLIIPLGLVYSFDHLGLLDFDAVIEKAASPAIICLSIGVGLVYIFLQGKRKPEGSGYSSSDRLLHRLAFSTVAPQIAIADIETAICKKRIAHLNDMRPVFITGLPRSGTTLLLECCSQLPEMATHRYRDMPYVMIPYLWERFSKIFGKSTKPKQRYHGDGIIIDQDSPEALEEMLWLAFWRKNYKSDRITVWAKERNEEFEDFFRDHMKKIIFLRSDSDCAANRYLSKNNLNIARTGWLRDRFPESTILVPFRPPLQHAASLLKQHNNFLRIQESDPFALEYMTAIGHFDFGKNLKPINFSNWIENRISDDSNQLIFWLEYWVASYRYLLKQTKDRIQFFDYQLICENPKSGLISLGQSLGTNHLSILENLVCDLRTPSFHETDTRGIPGVLLRESESIFQALVESATNRRFIPELASQ